MNSSSPFPVQPDAFPPRLESGSPRARKDKDATSREGKSKRSKEGKKERTKKSHRRPRSRDDDKGVQISAPGQQRITPSAVPGSMARPTTPRMRTGSMPLTHTDDSTYISVIKSDIFQVQMRMETVVRGIVRNADTRCMTPSRSKRHAELKTIRDSTDDVNAICQETSNPVEVKLRLLEHLMSNMMQMELHVLRATDKTASSPFRGLGSVVQRPSTASKDAQAPPGLSRLPSFLGVHDRLLEFSTKMEEAATKQHPSMTSGVVSKFEETIDELEGQIHLLEAELSMRPQTSSGFGDRGAGPLQALLTRIKRAGVSVEIIRERGVRFLQQESQEVQQTSRAIADTLETTRRDLRKLEQEGKDTSGGPSDTTAAPTTSSDTSTQSKREKDLLQKVEEYKQAANMIKELKTKENAEMQRELDKQTAKCEQEKRKRGEEAERYTNDLAEARRAMQMEGSEAQIELMHAQTELAQLKARQARLEQRYYDLDQANNTSREDLETERKQTRDIENREEEELAAVRAELAVVSKQLQALAADSAKEADTTIKAANEALNEQVAILGAEVAKWKRAHSNRTFYSRESDRKQQAEQKRQTMCIKNLQERLEKAEHLQVELERVGAEEKKALTEKMNAGGNNVVQQMFAEEMRGMKRGYELKLNKAKEDLAKATLQHNQKMRLLTAQLDEQRKNSQLHITSMRTTIQGYEAKART